MNRQELKSVLISFANTDLRLARKHGVVAVCQTLIGNLEIKHDDGIYSITDFNTGVKLTEGKANVARNFLVENYDLVVAA